MSIRPIHHSVANTRTGRVTPYNMEKLHTTREQAQFLERHAISIFTDTINAGHTFQAALAAIYLSGIENAVALTKELQQ